MPIVHVNVWEGFGEEKIKIVIKNMTKVFADLGVPAHAVEVIVHEIPKTNWGIGGEPASEKFKENPQRAKSSKDKRAHTSNLQEKEDVEDIAI